jgi:hypothetical protein
MVKLLFYGFIHVSYLLPRCFFLVCEGSQVDVYTNYTNLKLCAHILCLYGSTSVAKFDGYQSQSLKSDTVFTRKLHLNSINCCETFLKSLLLIIKK